MVKQLNAYLSLEASVVFSITTFIYYLIIMSSLLLLGRGLMSQNDYILGIRAAAFTESGEEYGGIIYADDISFDTKMYVMDRIERLRKNYFCLRDKGCECVITPTSVRITQEATMKIGDSRISKECRKINPVMRIRELRY